MQLAQLSAIKFMELQNGGKGTHWRTTDEKYWLGQKQNTG